MTPTFEAFPKIARLNREMIVTEKLDGTNAAVGISDDGIEIWTQSRTRLLVPGDDNHGFARWVEENKDCLLKLGPGLHFGEWWGGSIQKRYPGTKKQFSLFNVSRWENPETRPVCCGVVPVLYRGPFDVYTVNLLVAKLRQEGSVASPGNKAEGVVVFLPAANQLFKVTCEKDESPKSLVAE